MTEIEKYKQKLEYMKKVTDVGLDDLEKLDIGLKALSKYYERAVNMSEEYRANFINIFGQGALDKKDRVTNEIGLFLSKMKEIMNDV